MLIVLAGCAHREPLATVGQVDLPRYAGVWHEVARYPNFFQREGDREITARYTLRPDGRVEVLNRCLRDGAPREIRGTAKALPGSGNARLAVTFFPPFSGDYWVIGLDEKNYSWAVVGHPSRRFLWILSRQVTLPPATYERILRLLRERGYDPGRLIVSPAQSTTEQRP